MTGSGAIGTSGANSGKVVLGHYPDYKKVAERIGAKYFNIPAKIWEKMNTAKRWIANKKFLDRAVSRGDELIPATKKVNMKEGYTYYHAERSYLKRRHGIDLEQVIKGGVMFEFYREIYERYGTFFQENSFEVLYFEQDNRNFGSSVLEVCSSELGLRFICDRGLSSVQVGSCAGDCWVDVLKVARVFFGVTLASSTLSPETVSFFQTNYIKLVGMFSRTELKTTMQRLG